MTPATADSFELSPQQEQLWLREPDGPSGRVQGRLSLQGPLDASRVRAALREAVARHEILRTSFVRQPGIRVPVQAVAPALEPAFAGAALNGSEDPEALETLASQELAAGLELDSGPLVRALLVDHGAEQWTLLVTASSLCADASSIAVLSAEIARHLGSDAELIADPLQYADYAAWQRELQAADDPEAVAAREFWRAVEESSAPPVPRWDSRPGEPHFGSVALKLSHDLQSALEQTAHRYGASPSELALAAWGVVLAASTGEPQLRIGFVGGERRHADLDGAVGAFARSVPLALDATDSLTFAELLSQAQHEISQAGVWQDYAPVEAAVQPWGFIGAPAFKSTGAGIEVSLEGVLVTDPGLSVALSCIAGQGETRLTIEYRRDVMTPEEAEPLADRLTRALEAASADPGRRLSELELIGERERATLLELGRGGDPRPGDALPDRFAGHAATAPEHVAVIDEHGAITYGELDRRANQLANRLVRAGVGPDVTVGLCTDRSIDMVVGLLGILKAGGAYVPLHHEHPPARLSHQLRTAGAVAVVTQETALPGLEGFDAEFIFMDRDRAQLDEEDVTAPGVQTEPSSLAYVIYTSGSTGTPKGVAVTHGNLANYVSALIGRLELGDESSSFGLVTSISTDLGNTSVFGALGSGGTLILISPVAAADAGAMVRQLERAPVDVLKITPSHLGALIAGGDTRVLPRRWLVIGGERATWDLVDKVRELSSCQILNHYGPTEATIGCCTQLVSAAADAERPPTVPIGRPLDGDRAYLLTVTGELTPRGAPGRLHIAGAGVARGYIGEPELTRERFREDPFLAGGGAMMYDTGDLARWLSDGSLEFLGRADEQVKIRGYRVEPAEVETALRSHPEVSEAVVVARTSKAGDTALVAYCNGAESQALRSHLTQWLPEFMIPSTIVILDAFPLTPSGKIDRLALPDPDEVETASNDYVEPRTPVEAAVAEVWANVLGLERVGAEDDFFALGGHSLLATQVVAQVRSDFAVELPLHSVFTYPTVATLSAEIVGMMSDSEREQTERLMAQLEGLSDAEAEELLARETLPPDAGSQA